MTTESTASLRKEDSKVVFKKVWDSWALGNLPCLSHSCLCWWSLRQASCKEPQAGSIIICPLGCHSQACWFCLNLIGFWQKLRPQQSRKRSLFIISLDRYLVYNCNQNLDPSGRLTVQPACWTFLQRFKQPVFLLSNGFPRSTSE